MAMKPTDEPMELLDRSGARTAGAASVILALVAAAALIFLMVSESGVSAPCLGLLITLTVLFIIAAAIGGLLVPGDRPWAQRALLVFWLIAAATAAGGALGAVFWGAPSWWALTVPLELVVGVLLVAGALEVVLLIRASATASRLRYASIVTVSLVVAAVLVFVVNMIAQKDPIRRDVEMLGRWSLSDRTKAILSDLDKPVRLTSLYTPGYMKRKAEDRELLEERRSRVWELLQDMREHSRNIEIENLTSDAERAALVERLREQFGGQATEHVRLLTKFQTQSGQLVKALTEQRRRWSGMSPDGYIAQWGWPTDIAKAFKNIAENFNQTTTTVRNQMAGLPDYPALTSEVTKVLESTKKNLENISGLLKRVDELPDAVKAGEKNALKLLDTAIAAVESLAKVIGKPEDPAPKNPPPVLKKIADSAGKASEKLTEAAKALENVAGNKNVTLLLAHRAWRINLPGSLLPTTIPQGLTLHAENIERDLKQQTESVAAAANTEYQKQYITKLRKGAPGLVEDIRRIKTHAANALEKTRNLDPQSEDQKILTRAAKGELFQSILKPVSDLLREAHALPKIKSQTLPTNIMDDNIVIVEVGKKVEVAGFDEVFPLRAPLGPMMGAVEEEPKRVFNGEVIGSKILKMTHEPFARVVLTYLPPNPRLSQIAFGPGTFSALRRRLEAANFEVTSWDLDKDAPDVDAGKEKDSTGEEDTAKGSTGETLQKVLLILPPPPAFPPSPYSPPPSRFGDKHIKKIREEIDSGTPAIFLVHSDFKTPLMGLVCTYDKLNGYLKDTWGIDVKFRHRVIATRRDETEPDRFRIDLGRWGHLPLSEFTDHAIGKPLQGHRVLWTGLCPIMVDSPPQGVRVETVLEIPGYYNDIWAAEDLGGLLRQLFSGEEGLIAPTQKDIFPPMRLGVAATRGGSDKVKPTRIAVLAMAASLRDGYLDEPILAVDRDRTLKSEPPPTANADAVINSVFWLIGKRGYIAAGPVRTKPVARMDKTTLTAIQILITGGLPAAVLIAGMVVMIVRRR